MPDNNMVRIPVNGAFGHGGREAFISFPDGTGEAIRTDDRIRKLYPGR